MMQTSPQPFVLSRCHSDGLKRLCRFLLEESLPCPGVVGPVQETDALCRI